ncbi:MAG: PASTA domain-containing protein [Bacteroidales bacterium]|nr:PASTA domain-containing protein [Bacteroidales bacterium]
MKDRIIAFFTDKYMYLHVGGMILFVFLVYVLIKLFLTSYTNHGEQVPVPNFKGLSFERALEIADESNLEIVVQDSVYSTAYPKGTIVEHQPQPGLFIKEGRKIFITMNADTPPNVKMPELVDESLRQAVSTIESAGLKVGKIIYKIGFKDLVLEQLMDGKKIKSGIQIPKGTSIDLFVGKGDSDEKTFLPKLIGLDYKDAIAKVASAGLNIDFVQFSSSIKTKEDSANAVVWKQLPLYHAETQISIGGNIDIWLVPADELSNMTDNDDSNF